MDRWRSARVYRPGLAILKTQVALVAAAAVPLLLLIMLLPRPSVLPVLSLLALTGAGLVAAYAWFSSAQYHSDRVTPWDIAGALAFIGFAAGAVSEPDQVLALLDHASMTR
jgi:hypothetical protein